MRSFAVECVRVLPADGAEVVRLVEGVLHVRAYRCSKLTTRPSGLEGERLRVLTGGVQLEVRPPYPRYGPTRVFSARLPPGWSEEQVIQRLAKLLCDAREQYELDLARDAVWAYHERMAEDESLQALWEAAAYEYPGACFVPDLSRADCEFWLGWFSSLTTES